MKTLQEIVKALKKSNYTCRAGELDNCVEFAMLEKKANDAPSYCCLGSHNPCQLNVNGGYCAADACQYKVMPL